MFILFVYYTNTLQIKKMGVFYTLILGLLVVCIAHVGLKLFVLNDKGLEIENMHTQGIHNKHNDDMYRPNGKPMLWKKTNTNIGGQAYGHAPAKTEHAHPGKRGPPIETVPNYPIPISANDLSDLTHDLEKELDGYFAENAVGAIQGEVSQVSNMPVGGPIIGRPTKEPYKETLLGIENRTSDGDYMSYENMMYGKDAEQFAKNNGINPRIQDMKYYAEYDRSPINGC